MKIRNKITVYFSLATLILTGIAFVLIYLSSYVNREEEFQMRQKDKIGTTLKLLAQIKQTDSELVTEIDILTIHDLYDEKLLLFNANKQLIYSSVDDVPVPFSQKILSQLTPHDSWVESKDGLYDVIGVYVHSKEKSFYGISKAYDTFGYSKLLYLKYLLISTFIGISILVIAVSFYLSKKITEPLLTVTQKVQEYNFEKDYSPLAVSGSKNEVDVLAEQFNRLMKRMNEAFSFQKHAVHHISHELKTPISILVSNFEKIEKETDPGRIKALIRNQKEDTKNLGEIINSLLEIAKTESGNVLMEDRLRVDELIFDIAEELAAIYPDFHFNIGYASETGDERLFTIKANTRLIKSALMNLMQNSIQYSTGHTVKVTIGNEPDSIRLVIENNGKIIPEDERQYLFQHFFRGKNSKGKRGFGLGLVLVHKIVSLHRGTVAYNTGITKTNAFIVTIPLR